MTVVAFCKDGADETEVVIKASMLQMLKGSLYRFGHPRYLPSNLCLSEIRRLYHTQRNSKGKPVNHS